MFLRINPYNFWEAMAGSLSVARMAISSAKVAMVVVVEVGRLAVYMRYRNVPRTLPWGMPALIGDRMRQFLQKIACCANRIGEVGNVSPGSALRDVSRSILIVL
jgi:hypothetical protein